MKIHTGLLPSCVVPRNAANVSELAVTGTCRAAGPVDAAVYAEGADAPLLRLPACGAARKGRFTAQLDGIPCGGPYRVELACGTERVAVSDVLVGEVWILAGQSNMQGEGDITEASRNSEPRIRAYYMDDKWAVAEEPVGRVELSRHPAHLNLLNPPVPSRARKNPSGHGAEPGLPFAIERFRQTGVPQGLLACAHGGTNMSQWDPKTRGEGYGSLYGAMLERVRRNGGRVTGMLWYQGCSDAVAARYAAYEEATVAFFRAVRRDLRAPALPIAIVQLARLIAASDTDAPYWDTIRDAQRRMPRRLRHLLAVPALDLSHQDSIHLDEPSQITLGRRLAQAMRTLLGEPGALPPPVELDRVAIRYRRRQGQYDVHVHFRNVVGALQAAGRPSGFSFGPDGRDLAYRTDLEGDCAILHCTQEVPSVAYGHGLNPYCNIADAAGRPLPAFAFQPLVLPFVRGPYATHFQLSAPLFGDLPVSQATPQMAQGLAYAPAANQSPYGLFPDRLQYADRNGIRFFRTAYLAPRALDLDLALGYDGNVKVFVDGKPVYTDEQGRNPIILASHLVHQHWAKGRHEILVAVAMNQARTWGISLALETAPARKDDLPQEVD